MHVRAGPGVTQDGNTVRPGQDWAPPLSRTRIPPPPLKNSRVSTFYAAGGMPFVFTQKDFLVFVFFCFHVIKPLMPISLINPNEVFPAQKSSPLHHHMLVDGSGEVKT